MTKIITLDLHFQNIPKAIAAYLVPHGKGAVLIESGPGSTVPALVSALAEHGFAPEDISTVLLTHIHLDHAGAAGWLAEQGAQVFVHPVGAPHMQNPDRLIASATRIYGDRMDTLWGAFLPVPASQLQVLEGDGEVEIDGLHFTYLDTPGHASHHISYLLEGTCFTGDVGGVRLPGPPYLRLPTPPPEFHIEAWRGSIRKIEAVKPERIAPTHFGIYTDADWHLRTLAQTVDEIEAWIEATLPSLEDRQGLHGRFSDWELERCRQAGLDDEILQPYALAMPLGMGADGLWRYWQKYRAKKKA